MGIDEYSQLYDKENKYFVFTKSYRISDRFIIDLLLHVLLRH